MRGVSAKGVRSGGVSERAISTVLDVALCLLLVTASALTLAGAPPERESSRGGTTGGATADSADQTADLLATSTARVTYAVGDRTRTAHDTLAGLLADAARADAQADGPGAPNSTPNSTVTATFVEAVVDRVERVLRWVDPRVQVVARWLPASERPADGRVVAGGTPRPDADVHAAELTVGGARFTVRTWSA